MYVKAPTRRHGACALHVAFGNPCGSGEISAGDATQCNIAAAMLISSADHSCVPTELVDSVHAEFWAFARLLARGGAADNEANLFWSGLSAVVRKETPKAVAEHEEAILQQDRNLSFLDDLAREVCSGSMGDGLLLQVLQDAPDGIDAWMTQSPCFLRAGRLWYW